MLALKLAPRSSPDEPLRCAFCHDDALAGDVRPCVSCRTLLHPDCWDLAGVCPTLGCACRLRQLIVRVTRHAVGATRGHLFAWLAVFSAVWATLVLVVPAFAKMFVETGLTLPAVTEALVGASGVAHSLWGIPIFLAIVGGSIAAYRRYRERSALRRTLVALSWLGIACYGPLVVYALFAPLISLGCQRL